jgi:hypothetical protein
MTYDIKYRPREEEMVKEEEKKINKSLLVLMLFFRFIGLLNRPINII